MKWRWRVGQWARIVISFVMYWLNWLVGRRARIIICCQGGGVRGIWTARNVQLLEDGVRAALNAGPDFRLRDKSDFFVGSSTGAIIATAMCLGLSGREILDLYTTRMREMFSKASIHKRLHAKYDPRGAEGVLREELGERMRDASTPPFLAVCAFNATTGNPALFTDAPLRTRGVEHPHLDQLPLWQATLASSAASYYFPPVPVNGELHVDAAMAGLQNPAAAGLHLATDKSGMGWRRGRRRVLLIDLGTLRQPPDRLDAKAGLRETLPKVPNWLIESGAKQVVRQLTSAHRRGDITYCVIDRDSDRRVDPDDVDAVPYLMEQPPAVDAQTIATVARFARRVRRRRKRVPARGQDHAAAVTAPPGAKSTVTHRSIGPVPGRPEVVGRPFRHTDRRERMRFKITKRSSWAAVIATGAAVLAGAVILRRRRPGAGAGVVESLAEEEVLSD